MYGRLTVKEAGSRGGRVQPSAVNDPSVSQLVFTFTAPTRAFSWLKAPTSAFTFKTLLRHYAMLCSTGVDPTVSRREIGSPMQLS